MCVNTDKYPRRNSTSTYRPPRYSQPMEDSSTMIDSYDQQSLEYDMDFSKQPMQKSVSFDETVMVRPVLPLIEFTDEEIINCWWLPVEKQRMRQEIMSVLKVIKEKNKKSKKQFNVRGLEWLAQKDKVREKARKASIKDILKEQSKQRASGEGYDSHRFRKVYKEHSRSAMHLAYSMGKIDAMEAGNASETSQRSQRSKRRSSMSNMEGVSAMGKAQRRSSMNNMTDGNNSMSKMNESWTSDSTRSTRSSSTRSTRSAGSISTKGTAARKTKRGSRRFSIA